MYININLSNDKQANFNNQHLQIKICDLWNIWETSWLILMTRNKKKKEDRNEWANHIMARKSYFLLWAVHTDNKISHKYSGKFHESHVLLETKVFHLHQFKSFSKSVENTAKWLRIKTKLLSFFSSNFITNIQVHAIFNTKYTIYIWCVLWSSFNVLILMIRWLFIHDISIQLILLPSL